MRIIAHLPQIAAAAAAVHKKRFVASAKEMTPKTVPAIELLSVGTQKPLHARAQVAARRFYYEMKMIAHQTVGVNLPTGPAASLSQKIKE